MENNQMLINVVKLATNLADEATTTYCRENGITIHIKDSITFTPEAQRIFDINYNSYYNIIKNCEVIQPEIQIGDAVTIKGGTKRFIVGIDRRSNFVDIYTLQGKAKIVPIVILQKVNQEKPF
jgi:hypothetical protein